MINETTPTTAAGGSPLERRVGRLVEDEQMVMNNRFFACFTIPGGGWFRVLGYGVAWKDTRRHRLFFSELNGYVKHLMLGPWSFKLLRT